MKKRINEIHELADKTNVIEERLKEHSEKRQWLENS